VEAAAQFIYTLFGFQEGLGGYSTQGTDNLRPYYGQLFQKMGITEGNFIAARGAVIRWAAFDDIGDIDIIASEADGLNYFGEKGTGTAHKRQALPVLFIARALAHKDQIRIRVSGTEDEIGAAETEPAGAALFHFLFQGGEALGLGGAWVFPGQFIYAK
jgi:hypothetical protein